MATLVPVGQLLLLQVMLNIPENKRKFFLVIPAQIFLRLKVNRRDIKNNAKKLQGVKYGFD